MVELEGSVKQVKWGISIREECLNVIDKYIVGVKELNLNENLINSLNKFKIAFGNQKEAKWFIDNFAEVLKYKLTSDKQIDVFNYHLTQLFNKKVFSDALTKHVRMKEYKKN